MIYTFKFLFAVQSFSYRLFTGVNNEYERRRRERTAGMINAKGPLATWNHRDCDSRFNGISFVVLKLHYLIIQLHSVIFVDEVAKAFRPRDPGIESRRGVFDSLTSRKDFTPRIEGKRPNSVASPTREAPKHLSGYCRHQWFDYSPRTWARSILGGVAPGFSHFGIVPGGTAGHRVFSGISRFLRPCIATLLQTHLASPSSALKTSMLRAAHISSPTHSPVLTLFVFIYANRSIAGKRCRAQVSRRLNLFPGSIPGSLLAQPGMCISENVIPYSKRNGNGGECERRAGICPDLTFSRLSYSRKTLDRCCNAFTVGQAGACRRGFKRQIRRRAARSFPGSGSRPRDTSTGNKYATLAAGDRPGITDNRFLTRFPPVFLSPIIPSGVPGSQSLGRTGNSLTLQERKSCRSRHGAAKDAFRSPEQAVRGILRQNRRLPMHVITPPLGWGLGGGGDHHFENLGAAVVSDSSASHLGGPGFDARLSRSRVGNRPGRCRWSEGFFFFRGSPVSRRPFHIPALLYTSSRFTLVGSQDLDARVAPPRNDRGKGNVCAFRPGSRLRATLLRASRRRELHQPLRKVPTPITPSTSQRSGTAVSKQRAETRQHEAWHVVLPRPSSLQGRSSMEYRQLSKTTCRHYFGDLEFRPGIFACEIITAASSSRFVARSPTKRLGANSCFHLTGHPVMALKAATGDLRPWRVVQAASTRETPDDTKLAHGMKMTAGKTPEM
ncbi:hypothetical protein PR048_007855 [Dryococelus australis]|uniref:Uncharacterized protein n=1 Tax=Dryococelus australis TaxID=614101 RepID=A0ABQ9HVL3_9NEOP|nr:hypothetical protein PR048_007855 [Dryococelus australis]